MKLLSKFSKTLPEKCPENPRGFPGETPAEITGEILRLTFEGIHRSYSRGISEGSPEEILKRIL